MRQSTAFMASGAHTGLEEALLPGSADHTYSDSLPATQASTKSNSDLEEHAALMRRRMQQPEWAGIDRGSGFYSEQRHRLHLPCLVQTGRHAGRSRVHVTGLSWRLMLQHKFKRDFFNSAVNAPLPSILAALALLYFSSLLFWSLSYYILWSVNDECFTGFGGIISAFLFAVETQQTIGYGTRAPGECWATFVLISVHSLVAVVLDSLILGITFARVSHPKNRGRTILVSDCAVIARRDGELKFMFRVADLMPRQVVNPFVTAYLFTWGPNRTGHVTAEGERLPVNVQAIPLSGLDSTLLLPVTVEHTIDERSPLAGQTQRSLEAVGAEVVVLFSATTELGVNFNIRRSYLPQEIHWGHVFAQIVHPAHESSTQHSVDISRFHDVEPQPGLDLVPLHKLADKVMTSSDRGALPAPRPGTNTLVLSEAGVVAARDGQIMLMFRVGDVYPGGQVMDVQVQAYLYRWQVVQTAEGELLPYTVHELRLVPSRPCLRYPATICHIVSDPSSPISSWVTAEGKRRDSDAEVLVIAKGVSAFNGLPVTRQRVYPVLAGVRWGSTFRPVVAPPPPGVPTSRGRAGGMPVEWSAFNATAPAQMDVVPVAWTAKPPIRSTPSSSSGTGTAHPPTAQHSQSGPGHFDDVFGHDGFDIPHADGAVAAAHRGHAASRSGSGHGGASRPAGISVAAAASRPSHDFGPQSLSTWHGPGGPTDVISNLTAFAASSMPQPPHLDEPTSKQEGHVQPQSRPPLHPPAGEQQQHGHHVRFSASESVAGSPGAGSGPPAPVQVSEWAQKPDMVRMASGGPGSSAAGGDGGEGLGMRRSSSYSTSQGLSTAAAVAGPYRPSPQSPRNRSEKTTLSAATGNTSTGPSHDWRTTRSLFAAMEEMSRLAAEEGQPQHQPH